jgi:hypothetical protein
VLNGSIDWIIGNNCIGYKFFIPQRRHIHTHSTVHIIAFHLLLNKAHNNLLFELNTTHHNKHSILTLFFLHSYIRCKSPVQVSFIHSFTTFHFESLPSIPVGIETDRQPIPKIKNNDGTYNFWYEMLFVIPSKKREREREERKEKRREKIVLSKVTIRLRLRLSISLCMTLLCL